MRLSSVVLRLTLIALILVKCPDLSAQVVAGLVNLEGETQFSGAQISLLSPSGKFAARTGTDEEGRFILPSVSPGKYFVGVNGSGCEGWQAGPLALERGDTVLLSLSVSLEEVPVPPFQVVSSSRPWYEHLQPEGLWPFWGRRERYEALGTGTFFTGADLEPWKGSSVVLTLSALSPFLQAEPAPRDPSTLLLLGRQECTPLVFVDGHRVRQGTEGSAFQGTIIRPIQGTDIDRVRPILSPRGNFTPVDQFISIAQIAGIEVYRGASDVPGEFRREDLGTRCGAVLIWSHRGPIG